MMSSWWSRIGASSAFARLIVVLTSCSCAHGALPRLVLEPTDTGAMQLVAQGLSKNDSCNAPVFTPRGVALAVKGAPWIPVTDHFDPNVSLSEYDFELLSGTGVNLIRLGVMMPGVLPNPPVNGSYSYDQAYIDQVKQIVEMAAKYGMYTLIEFHQDLLSEFFCGEGLPRWAAEEIEASFDAEFEEEVVELLRQMHLSWPIEDFKPIEATYRRLIRKNLHKAKFPAPIAKPYSRMPENATASSGAVPPGGRVYPLGECNRGNWEAYQLSFAAGHAYRRMFNLTSSTFQHMRAYWNIVAEAFNGSTNVLGFDLFNEPFPGSPFTEPWVVLPGKDSGRLSRFYTSIAQDIHAIDPYRLVTFSPVTWEEGDYYLFTLNSPADIMCDFFKHLLDQEIPACKIFFGVTWVLPEKGMESSGFTEAPLPNQSILSFHFYTPPQFNCPAYVEKRVRDAQRLHVYPLLTETCCVTHPEIMQHLYWFEQSHVGWIVWEYKVMYNDYGFGAHVTGVGPDMFERGKADEVIKPHWRRLAHPSAQWVRGKIVQNTFDFTHGTFNLTFLPKEEEDCSQAPDAIIMWPWTWWAYIGVIKQPHVIVVPAKAANVTEVPCDSVSNGDVSEVLVCWGVHALWRNGTEIAVTLGFKGFKHVDLIYNAEAPRTGGGPWWAGFGWILQGVILLACILCCCCRCLSCCCGPSTQKQAVKDCKDCVSSTGCELAEDGRSRVQQHASLGIALTVEATTDEESAPLVQNEQKPIDDPLSMPYAVSVVASQAASPKCL